MAETKVKASGIEGTPIGGTTPAAGSFTTINGVTTDSTTNKPVTAASLAGGTLPVSATTVTASGSSSNSISIQINNTYTGGKNWTLYSSGGGPAPAGVFGLYNSTDGTNAFRFTHGGGLAVTGSISATSGISVGGATPGTGGIAFPATAVAVADANTLDDYEEGTWTPVLGGAGGTSGQTYSFRSGRYTKVGNLVTCIAYIQLATKGTITGNLQFQGFPFTAGSATYSTAALGYARFWTLTASHILCATLDGSASALGFYEMDFTGVAPSALTTAAVADGTQIYLSISYTV